MEADRCIAESPEFMAIAIEFRLKALISKNSSDGENRMSEGESKAYR